VASPERLGGKGLVRKSWNQRLRHGGPSAGGESTEECVSWSGTGGRAECHSGSVRSSMAGESGWGCGGAWGSVLGRQPHGGAGGGGGRSPRRW
jgi:hypothetical protein